MPVTSQTNWWPSDQCAKAFWAQQDLPPYQQLLNDTLSWASPQANERWLDLGCGGGTVSRAIWDRTQGAVKAVVGLDCAAVNEVAYRKLRESIRLVEAERFQFVRHDFSEGLQVFHDGDFDHAVSGLSISYAESFDAATQKWTTAAYDRLLAEVRRVLRPGGRFVFSVNVPEPSWAKVAWPSLTSMVQSKRVLQSLKRSYRMLRYGSWLKHEARTGRFHYFPADEVKRRLNFAGFRNVVHQMSYNNQAYIFQAVNPVIQNAA